MGFTYTTGSSDVFLLLRLVSVTAPLSTPSWENPVQAAGNHTVSRNRVVGVSTWLFVQRSCVCDNHLLLIIVCGVLCACVCQCLCSCPFRICLQENTSTTSRSQRRVPQPRHRSNTTMSAGCRGRFRKLPAHPLRSGRGGASESGRRGCLSGSSRRVIRVTSGGHAVESSDEPSSAI